MHILLAEDDANLGRLISSGLREAHFTPDHAGTAAEALAKIKVNNYDLAVLDWCFAGEELNGLDLLRAIRKQKKSTPIIMLTQKSALIERITGLNSGADDYLSKPFFMPELVARIHSLLRRKEKTELTEREIHTSGLVLDTISYRVTLNDKPLILNNKEFQLLKFLLQKLGDVATREELIEKVWGDTDAKKMSNTIDVHIRRLRNKLGTLGKAIRTVRGNGYRFEPC